MTAAHLPDAHTECNTTGCLNLASTRVAGTPHCAQHARHERHHHNNSATTTLPAKSHLTRALDDLHQEYRGR